ncbi:hypothetical protein FHS89_000858 [Rubricella aquisinus]|uniref:DUF1153 domain-containing protein n=1 Tax=Rubricella aquisinus TaxID=2028108 RepID=A0A840WMG5_9RHOB|nr:DUF1153 domain-containing protein [Rubricella aquisinus]MBB5514852.1 hypothetical protein [Rubricella aquisinus]
MYLKKDERPVFTMDYEGNRISRADLPPRDTRRWVARRKALVVAAVNGNLIDREEACEVYGLSDEELQSWIDSLSAHGPNGLRVTALQRYR